MEFEAGAIVSLKSGGPPMTVVEVNGQEARCMWFAQSDDRLQEARIPLACLEAINDDAEDEDEDDA